MLRRCNLQIGGQTQKFTNYNNNKTKYAALYEIIAHCKIIMYAAIIMWARTGTVSTYGMSPFTVAWLLAL